jgi:biofilm PGA synthesis N-glycosyltransferase PgaC
MIILTKALLLLSIIGVIASFFVGPMIIFLAFLFRKKRPVLFSDKLPHLSIIIVAHNAENIVEKKFKNTLALNYPTDKREIIFFSDGSTDSTEIKAHQFKDDKIHFYSSKSHLGKANGMNKAVNVCSGDILIFTDINALLDKDSLLKLVPYFGDTSVGGVAGSKVIIKENVKLEDAQNIYAKWAGSLKWMENKLGCITTNDGKLYAIRKKLFREIPLTVTDDLYVCLSIILQNHRFLYNPDAKAFMYHQRILQVNFAGGEE